MEIRALRTGTVRIKTAMARGRGFGPLRPLRMLADRTFTQELPIHAWLIEHADGPMLIDTGELSATRDMPIARFSVEREQEIDRLLAAHGVSAGDLREVILTHLHGDHVNGLAHLRGAPVRAPARALRYEGWALRKRHVAAGAIELEARPFGAFARSAALTRDARVVAVALPGHAPGHMGVVVVRDDHHVLIAGDCAYSQEQLLDLQPDGVSLSARAAVASMRTVLAHARVHPTVLLPSHDPGSAARLSAVATLRV